MALEFIINPILYPLLGMNILFAIIIIAFVIALFITLIYKLITNQEVMKGLKDDMKSHQKEMKEHKKNPEKVMHIQKQAMEKNMQYMMHSFKPTLITMLPIIIIFGWLNGHLAFEPIMPNQEFITTAEFMEGVSGNPILIGTEGVQIIGDAMQTIQNSKASWTLKGQAGEYLLEYQLHDKSVTREVLITNEIAYKIPVQKVKDSEFKSLNIENNPRKVLNLFGWRIGWLGTYIIFSIVFSMSLRKILKIY